MPDAAYQPLVSVVIPTYRRPFSMLRQAVDSVLAQTYAPIELIVVSDNPPDSDDARLAAEGMAAYPQARLIQLERNSGAPTARNRGIREAKGELIAFLDDDDVWLPAKLARQVPCFADPAVGLVYCRGYAVDCDDVYDETRRSDYSNARWGFHTSVTFDELLARDSIGTTSQAVVRRSCFEDCGLFDERLKARQDYDRWLAITQKHKAVGVDEPLFLFRQHTGERITASPQKALTANAAVFEKYRADYRRNRTACMAYYYNRAFVLKQTGKRGAYLANAVRAFAYSPAGFVRKYRSYRSAPADWKEERQ